MNLEADNVVVLRVLPFRESSLLVRWVGERRGLLSAFAKGVFQKSSSFRGKLDLFCECRVAFVRGQRSHAVTLREAELVEAHLPLRASLAKLRQAAYAARLLESLLVPDAPVPGTYRAFRSFLDQLARRPPRPLPLLAFELQVLRDMGLLPDPERTPLSEPARRLARRLAEQGAACEVDPSESSAEGAACRAALQRWAGALLAEHLGKALPERRRAYAAARSE